MRNQLSKKEHEILSYLRENGRHTVTQIGRNLGMPRTTVFDKIKKLRKFGYINRFTAIIDTTKVGYSIYSYVLFKVSPQKKESFGEALAKSAHTNTVMRLGNDYDFLASMCFKDMEEMHAYLDIINSKYGLTDYKILYAAKELKREGFLANALALAGETDEL